MFDLGFLTIPLLSLLSVFGFAVITDINMIEFDVKSVPQMAQTMGYDAKNVRNTIMYKVYNISNVANTSRGVMYSAISNMRQQSLKNISESLGIKEGVLAVQGVLGLIPYRLKGKIVQEGDVLYMVITGFSSDNDSFIINLKSNKLVFDSAQIITGQTGFLGSTGNMANIAAQNTKLITSNAAIEIGSLLSRAAEAIVDRIDPYLLARYYFVLESPTAKFTKTLPQLTRCIDVLPRKSSIWPLLLWGRSYQFRGKYDEAIKIYKEIDKIEPHFPFTPLRWGETLATLERHQEAINMYQRAIANSHYYPDYPVARSAAYNFWADSLIALDQLDAAERVLRKGESHVPVGHERSAADALSHYALGRFLMNYRHNYSDAKRHLRQAVYKDSRPKYYKALQKLNKMLVPGYAEYIAATQKRAANAIQANPPTYPSALAPHETLPIVGQDAPFGR